MRNTQSITKCYLGCLCYSHEVEKTERLRYSKVKISIRKRPHVTRDCVLHKVVWFLFFLGFSQDINFYPFGRNWEWEGLPWNSRYYSHSFVCGVILIISCTCGVFLYHFITLFLCNLCSLLGKCSQKCSQCSHQF